MPQRLNDAQTDALLRALDVPEYRQSLARKIAGVKPSQNLPAKGTDKRRTYDSAMRRMQRYVTDSTEKRSFAKSPLPYRRELRQVARAVPKPKLAETEPKPRPKPGKEPIAPVKHEPGRPVYQDIPQADLPFDFVPEYQQDARYSGLPADRPVLQSIVAYHDGDAFEAARNIGGTAQAARLLELLTTSDADASNLRGYDALVRKAENWLDELDEDELNDIEIFSKAIGDLTDVQRGTVFQSLLDGDTTFADWIDHINDDLDNNVDGVAFWDLWRSTYKKAK